MQALYQLSYAPNGGFTLPVDTPGSSERGHYAPARDRARRRHPDAPLQRGAGQRDRARLAGPLGRRARVLDAQPHRAAGRGPAPHRRSARAASCSTCSRIRAASGLHVGHPLGFIATDVYARFSRMTGFNVLHAMGYDAFGLPAEQFAVQTGTHPRVTTEANIANMQAPAARARPRPRLAPRPGHHRRRLLPVDAVDLPADLQLLVRRRRRPRPADRRARRRAARREARRRPTVARSTRCRSPSSARSSTRTGSRTSRKRR